MGQITKSEFDVKIIRSIDGKWLGYSPSGSINSKEWKDSPVDAITWVTELDDVDKIDDGGLDLSEATLVKIKKTIQVEIYE